MVKLPLAESRTLRNEREEAARTHGVFQALAVAKDGPLGVASRSAAFVGIGTRNRRGFSHNVEAALSYFAHTFIQSVVKMRKRGQPAPRAIRVKGSGLIDQGFEQVTF